MQTNCDKHWKHSAHEDRDCLNSSMKYHRKRYNINVAIVVHMICGSL